MSAWAGGSTQRNTSGLTSAQILNAFVKVFLTSPADNLRLHEPDGIFHVMGLIYAILSLVLSSVANAPPPTVNFAEFCGSFLPDETTKIIHCHLCDLESGRLILLWGLVCMVTRRLKDLLHR